MGLDDIGSARGSYRRVLVVANRHAEKYVSELAKVDDKVIEIGQKRATLVSCYPDMW